MKELIIGKLIKKARKEARITQTELAQKMGLSRMMISRYEVGLNNIPIDQLQKLAGFVNKPITYFLQESIKIDITPKQLLEMITKTLPLNKKEIINQYTNEQIEKQLKQQKLKISLNKWLNTKITLELKPTDSTNYELSSSTDYTHK